MWPEFNSGSVHQAAIDGNLQALKDGIAQCGEYVLLEGYEASGSTALHLASQHGHAHVIDYILQAHPGLDVDFPAVDGTTPIQMAVLGGHLPAVRSLLKFGAAKRNADAVLDAALSSGNEAIISLLLDQQNQLRSSDPHIFRPPAASSTAVAASSVAVAPNPMISSATVVVEQSTIQKSTTTTKLTQQTTVFAADMSASEQVAHLLRRITELEDFISKMEEKDQCVICMDALIGTVILECGHMCLCLGCATTKRIAHCPVCQKAISRIVKTYRS